MPSFLLPATSNPPTTTGPGGNYLVSPAPGSAEWLRWFQNRKGNVPMDKGSVATDFDMVLAFKSLPAWYSATSGKKAQLKAADPAGRTRVMMYNGKELAE